MTFTPNQLKTLLLQYKISYCGLNPQESLLALDHSNNPQTQFYYLFPDTLSFYIYLSNTIPLNNIEINNDVIPLNKLENYLKLSTFW